jgi:hypothetical protein
MKNAIPKHVDTLCNYSIGSYSICEHLVPLQNLMEENAVDKSTNAYT